MSRIQKIDTNTASAYPSNLQIFDLPPTDVAINRSAYRELLPLNPVSDQPYTFRLFSDNLWVDLSKTFVLLEFNIEEFDATDNLWKTLATDKVAPIQALGQTFIRQLKVSFNNTEIYDSNTLYPYKAYLTTELNYSPCVKDSQLGAIGYYRDTSHTSDSDSGFLKRAAMVKGADTVQLCSKLDFDFGNQPQYLLNNTDVIFTIYRATDDFLLDVRNAASTKRFRLNVKSIKLLIKTIEIQPSLNVAIFNKLEKEPAKYAMRKTEVRSFFVTHGRFEMDLNIFNGIIPRRLTMGFVNTTNFIGSSKSVPFNFENVNVKEITVMACGSNFPSIPYNNNFEKKLFLRAFKDMHEGLGQNYGDCSNGITLDQFQTGWAIYVIPLTASLDDSGGFELVRTGATNLHVTFESATPAGGLELIVLAEFDQILSIDRDRRVFSDNIV